MRYEFQIYRRTKENSSHNLARSTSYFTDHNTIYDVFLTKVQIGQGNIGTKEGIKESNLAPHRQTRPDVVTRVADVAMADEHPATARVPVRGRRPQLLLSVFKCSGVPCPSVFV